MSTSNAWKRALPSSVRGGSPTRSKHTRSEMPAQSNTHTPTGPFCDPVDHAGSHTVGDRGSSSGTGSTPSNPGHIEQQQTRNFSAGGHRKNDGHGQGGAPGKDDHPPLIVSLVLDDATQSHISKLRSQYFPTSRNYLQGHITLFHALPSDGEHLKEVKKQLEKTCSSQHVFKVGLRPPTLSANNKAVFVPLSANPLYKVRSSLMDAFKKDLKLPMTDQDTNPKFWPHATVINKVPEDQAREAFEALKETKEVEAHNSGQATGLDLWFYRGGPWEHVRRFDFASAS